MKSLVISRKKSADSLADPRPNPGISIQLTKRLQDVVAAIESVLTNKNDDPVNYADGKSCVAWHDHNGDQQHGVVHEVSTKDSPLAVVEVLTKDFKSTGFKFPVHPGLVAPVPDGELGTFDLKSYDAPLDEEGRWTHDITPSN